MLVKLGTTEVQSVWLSYMYRTWFPVMELVIEQ